MKLIDNWRSAPKMLSVWTAGIGALAATIWTQLPEATQRSILERLGLNGIAVTVSITFLAIIAARLIRQESVSGPALTFPPIRP